MTINHIPQNPLWEWIKANPVGSPNRVTQPNTIVQHKKTEPLSHEAITFNASSSTTHADKITQYEWDFGDRETSTTDKASVTHSYSESGTYEVKLTVRDNKGETSTAKGTIVVVTERAEKLGGPTHRDSKGEGHAVVPYRVDRTQGKIYVSDPNKPNNSKCAVEVYYEDGTWNWKYKLRILKTWPPKNAIRTYIFLVPIEKLDNNGQQKVRPMGCGGSEATFFLEGDADLLLTDSQGRKTGFKDGSFFQEIPGVRPIDMLNGLPDEEDYSWRQAYYVSDDTILTAMVEGTNEGRYSLTKFGPGYFGDISGVYTEEGAIDNITLSSDNVELSFSEDQGPKTYNLTLNKNVNGASQTFAATNITTSANAVHQYTIDWDALSRGKTGVTMEIDSDGDGTFERKVYLSDTGVEVIEEGVPLWVWVTIGALAALLVLIVVTVFRRVLKRP